MAPAPRSARGANTKRYHSRQRNRHGETSRGHGGSDRWIGSQGVRDDKSEREARRGGSRLEDGYKERPRSCEEVRDVEHKTRRSEEMKGKAFKEEGKEDYQEKMFNQLVFKERGGPMKIEGARTKKISIVVKFGQHENKTALLNDSSNVARIQAEEKKNDSTQVVSINRAQCPAEQPPARADGGPPVSTATRKSGKDGSSHAQRNDNLDNWDDAEGHYTYRSGELLNGRYKIAAAHGKGMFLTVVRAKDLRAGKGDPEHVAIKIVHNNDMMNRAGKKEISILEKLASADSKNKHHRVKFLSSFRYGNHLCLVLESLDMSLRMALKKFTSNTGFDLNIVRASSRQLFIALKHLKNCKVFTVTSSPTTFWWTTPRK